MRKDLAKVLTEKPRNGSNSRNLKTRFRENGYDDREDWEDKYSLPKHGKMLMHNRDLGPWNEDKEFTDHLSPLKRWVEAQVGRNWDKVYSEIRKYLPNTNKQNHHLIDTHLMDFIERSVTVVKTEKGRKVYSRDRHGERELWDGDVYVDPETHILMKYKGNQYPKTNYRHWKEPESKTIRPLGSDEFLEKRGLTWAYVRYEWQEIVLPDGTVHRSLEMVEHHPLSKKELLRYGVKNDNKET